MQFFRPALLIYNERKAGLCMYNSIKKAASGFSYGLPTRFDDIIKEISAEKANIKAYKKLNEPVKDIKYYKLGDKLGDVLNKII